MFVSAEPTILHADADAFYASVEQRDDPRLRGRPVIVGAGVVLAASYEAKACGVCTAMGGALARRLCPRAVVVAPRMSAYSEASKAIYRVFEDTTPLVEGLSIDEAFLDVRGLRRLSGSPSEIAARLRRDVRDRVGLPITVGVARTKFLAKVASGVAKPNGLLVVPSEHELEFLHPLPIERLWGVGVVTADRLRRLGPRAVVVPPRMSAYSEASKAMFAVFEDTTPLVEGLSIDEAFLDVGGLRRIAGSPAEIAARLRAEVWERVGLRITVGVARTKFLAKVASG
ncbi:MAG: polymerase, partial [Gaiellaceae bacterium]|nr:polymerase [Gaiellaceae bacterium]